MRVMQTFGEPRDTTNPYIVMLRDALIEEPTVEHVPFSWSGALTGRYDVLHIHWSDTLLAARHWWTRAGKRAALACLIARVTVRPIAVVRTVHNLTPASGPYLDRALIRALEQRTDVCIRIAALTPEVGGVPSVLIPHGHYRSWFDGMPRAAPVPGQLGYAGLIKPYKGVERLVDAYAEASATDPTLTIRIAGKPTDEGLERRLRAATARLSGLDMTLRYVSESEFVDVVTSSELVVLPYRYMHNSGAALAALSLERPVLVPDNDVNRALASEVGPGWVHLFGGELTAGALLDAVRAVRAAPPTAAPDLSAREWRDAGILHAGAYRMAVDRRRRRMPAAPAPAARATAAPGTMATQDRVRELIVAIPTFHRPERLTNALTAVQEQIDDENGRPDAPMRSSILVIDNDPAGSAGPVASEHGVKYVVEPRPGIAAVRNRALAECAGAGADALLFLDDDETPESGWLRAMIEMYTTTRPTAVAGRVVTRKSGAMEPWDSHGNAFARPTRTHGQLMTEAATNNLLLDLDGVRRLGLSFDERFGLTGGSDSMFTLQLTRRGGTIRWAEDAVVVEQEDPERHTRSWLLMRVFRFGNTSARVRITLAPTAAGRFVERVLAFGQGGARVVGGSVRWAFGVVSRSLPHQTHGLRIASRGLGMMAGAVGYAHDEYGRRRSSMTPIAQSAHHEYAGGMGLKQWSFTVKSRTVRRSSGKYLAELLRNQHLSPEDLAQLQSRRAAAIARFAAESTGYYQRLFAEHGIDAARLEDPAEWERIPITERADLKENDAQLRPANSERFAREALTGGSTGVPLRTAQDSRVPTLALAWRMYSWWGVQPWDDLARLGRWGFGRLDTARNRLQWWPTKQIYLDASLMNADSMRKFHRAIVRIRPALIEGYVGGVLDFADFLEAEGLTIPTPTAIATTASPLPPSARRRIESVLGAPVYDEYRGAEMSWMAGECRMQNGLHIFADAKKIEVVDTHGKSLPAGEVGDIIVTDLANRVFPIVRYRMGDRGMIMNGICECGLPLPRMAQPDGRITDVLRLPSGMAVTRLTVMFAKHPESVRLFQIHQSADYSIAVRVVLGPDPDAKRHIEDEVEILRRRVAGEVPVTLEYVDSLPHTGAKIKYIISDVPPRT